MEFLLCCCGVLGMVMTRTQGNLLQDNEILAKNVKDVRILCQDEETGLKEQLSLWLMFEDANLAPRCSVMASFCLAQGAGCPSIITTNGENALDPHLLPHPNKVIYNLHQPQTTSTLSYMLSGT